MVYRKRAFRAGWPAVLVACCTVAVSVFTACTKDEPVLPEDPEETTHENTYYKLQRIENMPTGSEDNSASLDSRPPVFFNFGLKETVDEKYAKTKRWDISFGGMFNCYLSGNNGQNATNHGFMGPGVGGIAIVEKAFDEVVDIPEDSAFKTDVDVIGSDANGDYGDKVGWFLYDFNGSIVSDGRPEKHHVAYALSEPLTLKSGKVIPPRTLIVRTATGDYAKIKMISCYKDLFSKDQWFIDSPFIYFTFEYVLVPKGSTRFEIRD